MVVGAPVFVEGHDQEGVLIVAARGVGRVADRLVDRAQQLIGRRRVDGRVVIVVAEEHARLDEAVGRQLARLRGAEELLHVADMAEGVAGQPVGMDQEGQRVAFLPVDVDLPGQAGGLEPVEDRLGVVLQREIEVRFVVDEARGRGGMEEGAVRPGLRGDGAEPVVANRELAGQGREVGQQAGRKAVHDLAILAGRGIAPHDLPEVADVVEQEAVHRRQVGQRIGQVVGRRHRLGGDAVVRLRDDLPEQLRVDMLPFFARIGDRERVRLRGAHRDRSATHRRRERVRQVLEGHALERLAAWGRAGGRVQLAQDIV